MDTAKGDIALPANDWDTFTKHAWSAMGPSGNLDGWGSKSRCEDAAEIFKAFGCRSVLDAASGYGAKTVPFHRMGFDVLGIDIEQRSVELGQQLAKDFGLDVEFRCMSWADVPGQLDEQFDAVYNDNFPNAKDRQELLEAAQAAYSALKPEGIALFGSRPEDEWEMTPVERVERAWKGNDPSIWWRVDTPEGQVITIGMSERFPTGIFRHFLHLTDGKQLEHSGWFHNFEWTLEDFTKVLKQVGFTKVELKRIKSGQFEGVATK